MSHLLVRICASAEIGTQALELPGRVTREMEMQRSVCPSAGIDLVLDFARRDDLAAERTRPLASLAGPHSRWRPVRELAFSNQLARTIPKFRLETDQLWHFGNGWKPC